MPVADLGFELVNHNLFCILLTVANSLSNSRVNDLSYMFECTLLR